MMSPEQFRRLMVLVDAAIDKHGASATDAVRTGICIGLELSSMAARDRGMSVFADELDESVRKLRSGAL